ncbi:hypothetical protein [Acetobacterium bakii]|uniref:Uncharacterized protein n=1 Tax=Acetobacterium bakii TaxID=52689 RepID=A0A0L6U1I2_9FIRM|nr:hypothetical protein [Acetobacterium bakii]KNZ42217.1 hypothetical protein AKG39_07495 [Acetobacterium bakii]
MNKSISMKSNKLTLLVLAMIFTLAMVALPGISIVKAASSVNGTVDETEILGTETGSLNLEIPIVIDEIVPIQIDEIQTDEFNQWQRYYTNFTFDTSSRASAERAITAGSITATSSGIGALFGGPGGAAAAGGIGVAISSYSSDCISRYYSRFGNTGYGTVVAGRYGSKLRLGFNYYSDPGRKNLVVSYTYATDHYPI